MHNIEISKILQQQTEENSAALLEVSYQIYIAAAYKEQENNFEVILMATAEL